MTTQPKPASSYTKEIHQKYLDWLDFDDKQDFEDACRGFVAPLEDSGMVMNPDGSPEWNLKAYVAEVVNKPSPETVNPSLWRQTQLQAYAGLFKVCDRVYQVRSGDLANTTFIEGDDGVIVFDCGTSEQTSKASFALFQKHVTDKPIVAIIYSHTHIDHYGGVMGLVSPEDVASGKVNLIAPGPIDEFNKYALGENVIAGNAMSRRAAYAFGEMLEVDPRANAGVGIGLATNRESDPSYIVPTDAIMETGETRTISGVVFEFLLTPDTEAPLEMHMFLPQMNALSCAENVNHTLHNIQTLRGARTRDAANFAKFIDETLVKYGDKAIVNFGPHTWPVFENDRVRAYMESQRDAYKYLHDQTLRYANKGYVPVEIAEMFEFPEAIATKWWNRNYHGTLNHDVKAVFSKELGWWSGNPAELYPLPPLESAKRYVELAGADAIMADAQKAFDKGDYRWVVESLAKLVWAQPENQAAKELQADAYEQLGYQVESPQWRNIFLSSAMELRTAERQGADPTAGKDTLMGMPVSIVFDYTAVRLIGPEAVNEKLSINFKLTDTGETWHAWLSNGVLLYRKDEQDEQADATLTLESIALKGMLFAPEDMAEKLLDSPKVAVVGDAGAFKKLLGLLETFEIYFEMIGPNMPQDYLEFLK